MPKVPGTIFLTDEQRKRLNQATGGTATELALIAIERCRLRWSNSRRYAVRDSCRSAFPTGG